MSLKALFGKREAEDDAAALAAAIPPLLDRRRRVSEEIATLAAQTEQMRIALVDTESCHSAEIDANERRMEELDRILEAIDAAESQLRRRAAAARERELAKKVEEVRRTLRGNFERLAKALANAAAENERATAAHLEAAAALGGSLAAQRIAPRLRFPTIQAEAIAAWHAETERQFDSAVGAQDLRALQRGAPDGFVTVEFVRPSGLYAAGEVAAFSAVDADQLVSIGAARLLDQGN